MVKVGETNPLLQSGELPRFDRFDPAQVVPDVRGLLAELERDLDRLERDCVPTWEGLVLPLERMNERLAYAWGFVSHMLAVRNSDPLREAHAAVQGEVIAFGLRQAQSPALHGPIWPLPFTQRAKYVAHFPKDATALDISNRLRRDLNPS